MDKYYMIMIHDDGKDDDKYLDAVVFFWGGWSQPVSGVPNLDPLHFSPELNTKHFIISNILPYFFLLDQCSSFSKSETSVFWKVICFS